MKNRQQIEQEINEVKELLAKSAPVMSKELVEEANKTLAEMIEVLNKSEPLKKEGEEKPEGQPEVPPPAVEPEAGETPAHEASESPAQEASEGQQPEEGSAEEKPEGSEEVDELAQEIQGMDDESIQQLIETLQAELAKRSGGAPEVQPQNQQTPPPASDEPALKDQVDSMNQEMEGMKKSLAALQAENEKLRKSVAAAAAAPASKPAPMNRQVNVLEKSQKAPAPKKYSRDEMVSHLEKLQKSGDKRVNSELMLNACYVKTSEQERLFQEICEDMGIKFS